MSQAVPFNDVVGKDVSIIRFSDLSISHQMAVVWFYAVDLGRWDKVSLDSVESDLDAAPEMAKKEIQELLPEFSQHYGREYFVVASIPVDRLKAAAFEYIQKADLVFLLPKPVENGEFSDWNDFHAWSLAHTRVPDHGDDARWPVLLTGEQSVIHDGWKRLHSYVRSGHTHIPVIHIPHLYD
jgi:hypothetical protein